MKKAELPPRTADMARLSSSSVLARSLIISDFILVLLEREGFRVGRAFCLLGWDKCMACAKRSADSENTFKRLKAKDYFRGCEEGGAAGDELPGGLRPTGAAHLLDRVRHTDASR